MVIKEFPIRRIILVNPAKIVFPVTETVLLAVMLKRQQTTKDIPLMSMASLEILLSVEITFFKIVNIAHIIKS
jgi:hypothetical protein